MRRAKARNASRAREAFGHLSSETRALAEADAGTRIDYIRRDRFIEHAGVRPVKRRLIGLLGRPRTVRPQCVLLASESGSGKTALLRHLQRLYPDRAQRGSGRIVRSVVYSEVEPAPTLRGVQSGLLTDLGAPPLDIRHLHARNDLIKRYLSEFDTELVLFDEVQHLQALARRDRMLLLDWMKWVSTAGKASVVVSAAMSDGRRLIEHDAQLLTRFTEMAIPRFRMGIAFAQFLLTLERSMPLRRGSGLAQESLQRAILDESEAMQTLRGLTDGVVKVVQEAAVAAVTTGAERIELPLLSAWREAVYAEPISGHRTRVLAAAEGVLA
jgi:energy-coupling factor transporter ATP-binding protein EcfA2